MPMINVGGSNLPPEILQQQQALNRQQQMAQLLMQQGQQMPSGQMVSGRYVAPSFFQYAAPLFQTYAGKSLAREGDKAQADLAKALRQQYSNEMENYLKIQRGTPAVAEKYTEMAGPYGEGVGPNNRDISMPVAYQPAQNAVPADPMAANLYGSTAYNPVLQQLTSKKLLEGPKWKEITQINQQTGNTETYRYDESASDPRSTLQFLGISKPALSPSDIIKFRDEGIPIPAQYTGNVTGQAVNAPQVQGGNAPTTEMPTVGGQPQQQSQIKVSPVTLQRFGYNPFEGPQPPTDLGGKDLRAFKLDQKKPLTGEASKTVTGATDYLDSLIDYKKYIDTLKPTDLADLQVRRNLESKHKQVLLTGKNAYTLGVLNGGDERILNAVMPNYSDILVTKNTLDNVIQGQMNFGSGAIVSQYRAAEKAVPERLRKYVEIDMPKLEQKSDGKDLQSQLRSKGIPYQPKLYEYRVNPDGSVDRKRKIL